MKTLVTGGTGFLGKHLVAELARRGESDVRILARSAPSARGGGVDVAVGDVTDEAAVRKAMRGVKRVFHLAGLVSRNRARASEMMRVHVEGTRVLLREACRASVARVVVASSSGTVGVSRDGARVASERDQAPMEILLKWPYYASKVYQEREALEFGRREAMEVVCVNPSLLLGPGDDRMSSTRDVLDFMKGKVSAIPEGGLSFVDVRDVAAAACAAMEKGKLGERYLLGAANWTFERFLRKLEQVSGVLAPQVRVPRRVAELGLGLLDAIGRVTGRDVVGDRAAMEMAQYFWYIDSRKARAELGFAPREPEVTLVDTVRYLRRMFVGAVERDAAIA